jgi:hypothetical protein
MRTSSALLTEAEGLWITAFSGVITPSDLHSFHEQARQSTGYANFCLCDWRDSVCAFTNDQLHNPESVVYAGKYDAISWKFGAMLGREDQLPLLRDLERYNVKVLGNVRRVFSDHAECMKWSEKISNFLSYEDAESRQARLFI